MFVIDRSLYLSPEVVGEPGLRPLKEVDPFSLEALVAWLEKQPAGESYNFDCTDGSCLIGQYCASQGLGHLHYCQQVAEFLRRDAIRPGSAISKAEWAAVHGEWTFGAAKDRARKLLAEREK